MATTTTTTTTTASHGDSFFHQKQQYHHHQQQQQQPQRRRRQQQQPRHLVATTNGFGSSIIVVVVLAMIVIGTITIASTSSGSGWCVNAAAAAAFLPSAITHNNKARVGTFSTTRRLSSSWSRMHHNILHMTIISPFDPTNADRSNDMDEEDGRVVVATTTTSYNNVDPLYKDEILDLTWENVDLVLEEMRPYLIQDGGNVAIQDIDGPVVKLELQGACGSCPSSTMTMKQGLERRLKERIPEIQEVVQSMPQGPPLILEQVNVILDGVRPFLQVAGGSIDCSQITGVDSLQPTIWLEMKGSAASLNSVKLEIAQRLQRHFMLPGMRVEWK